MAQFGRALRSGRRGRKFESCRLDFIFSLFLVNAGIAQSVEHFTRNEGVVSSSLISSSTLKSDVLSEEKGSGFLFIFKGGRAWQKEQTKRRSYFVFWNF